MEQREITELLTKMNALVGGENPSIDSHALMQDPIVANRLAVELLQQVDRDSKPEVVVAPKGVASYFGYSVALAAWMRFVYLEEVDGTWSLPEGVSLSRKEKALVVLDGYDEATAAGLVEVVKKAGAVPQAVLSLTAPRDDVSHGCPCLSLL